MILTATPFRVSLLGGGSDYPEHFTTVGSGAVLGMAITQQCYVALKRLPPIYPDFNYRIVYQRVEDRKTVEEIEHPAVRGVLRHLNITEPLELSHMGDIPARAGMGASSAFVVGLLHAAHQLRSTDYMLAPYELTEEAIHVERNVIQEAVGCQDQTFAAHGGLLYIGFGPQGREIQAIEIPASRRAELEESMVLVYTGNMRHAHEMAAKQIASIPDHPELFLALGDLAVIGKKILLDEQQSLDAVGALLNDAWQIKRRLCNGITSPRIDALYAHGLGCGAIGGKLLGAGGGGFMLFWVPRRFQGDFCSRIGAPYMRARIASQGTRLIINEP